MAWQPKFRSLPIGLMMIFQAEKCSLFYLVFWILYDCVEKEIYLSFRIWSQVLEKYVSQKLCCHLPDYMSMDPKNSNLRSKNCGRLTPHSANLRAKKPIFAISYSSELAESYNGYGSQSSNGTWTGMIGFLINGHVEVAVGDFTMNTHRTKVVDFTVPICETT